MRPAPENTVSSQTILPRTPDPLPLKTYGLLAIAATLACALVYIRWRKKDKDGRLSALIDAARKRMVAELPFRTRALKALHSLYYPSKASLAFPCVLVACLVVADWVASLWSGPSDLAMLANLIAVEAGITTIVFPLIVFIIETTGDRSEMAVKKSEVLLKESFLFPVTICALAALVGFSLIRTKYMAFGVLILTTATTMWALYQIVRLLLNDHWLMISGRRLLQDKVRRSIWHAINERLGNNILGEKLKALDIKFYSFGFSDDREAAKIFRSDGKGYVVDVDFNRLAEFIAELPAVRPGANISDRARSKAEIEEKGPTIYFATRLGATLNESRNAVLSVERFPEIGEAQQKVLESIAKRIVITGETENFAKILRAEINRLKGYMISSIADQRTDSIDIAVDHYKAIAEAFMEELDSIGSTYSSESAKKEMGSLMGGWSEINSIDDDVHEFISRAVASKNVDVVHEVAFLPIAIAVTAIKHGDHYVYRRFIKYCRHFYQAAQISDDARVRDFLNDRATRHLREISDFYIVSELTKKNPNLSKLKSSTDFALETLLIYQSLAKVAMDRKDAPSLRGVIEDMNARFNRFTPRRDTYSVRLLERTLADQDLSDMRRAELTNRLPIQKERERAEEHISQRKRQIVFGLAALALKRYERDPNDVMALAMTDYLFSLVN